jgi:hypothetical protein
MTQKASKPTAPITMGVMTLAEFHGNRTPPAVRPKRNDVALPTKTITPTISIRFNLFERDVVSVFRVRKNQIPIATITTMGILI